MTEKNKLALSNKQNIVPQLRFPEFKNSEKWLIDKFSGFIKLYRGSSPRPINQFLTKDENGVNWIKIGDTKNAIGFRISSVEEKITKEGSKKSRKVSKGELILANSMSYGATYELEIEGCIYDGWFVLREYEDSFDKQFLLHLLNSDFLQIQYKRLAAGGIVQNISSDIVYNTLLPIFSTQEQQKIAACLSSLDEVITAETEKLDLLQDHKKGLLQQLFPCSITNDELEITNKKETRNSKFVISNSKQPKFRFPEFKEDGDWEETTIDELGKTISGLRGKKGDDFGSGVPYVTYKQVFGNSFVEFEECGKVKVSKSENQNTLKKGDILFTTSSETPHEVGFASVLIEDPKEATYLNSFCFALRPDNTNELLPNFSRFLFHSKDYREKVTLIAQGSTRFNLSKGAFIQVKLTIPKPKEQQKIAQCLSAADALIEAQTRKIEALQEHKKGLLQQLFPQSITNY